MKSIIAILSLSLFVFSLTAVRAADSDQINTLSSVLRIKAASTAVEKALKYDLLQELLKGGTDNLLARAIEVSKDSASAEGPTKSDVLHSIARVYDVETARNIAGALVGDLEEK